MVWFYIPRKRVAGGGGGGGASLSTWSPTDKTAGWTLSEGNLRATENTSNNENIRSTVVIPASGKYYFEVYNHNTSDRAVGLRAASDSINNNLAVGSHCAVRSSSGARFAGGGFSNGGVGGGNYGATAVVMYAVDRDNDKAWFGLNGTWTGSGDPVAGTNNTFGLPSTGDILVYMWAENNSDSCDANLRPDSSTWSYSPPTGFVQLP